MILLGLIVSPAAAMAGDWLKMRSFEPKFSQTCDLFNDKELSARIKGDETLLFSYGIDRKKSRPHHTFSFQILVSAEDGPPTVLFRSTDTVEIDKPKGRWNNREISLKPFAGRRIKFEFSSKPVGAAAGTADRGVWGGVRIANVRRARDQYNLILISLDTLRGDRLGVAGHHRRDISPHIDAAALGGAYFPVAITPAPWTKPAHMSVMTGLYPVFHGIYDDNKLHSLTLRSDIVPLAETLRDHGFVTQAYTENGQVSSFFGFSRGFDRYLENKRIGKQKRADDMEAENTFIEAGRWVERHREERFFLFVHTYEVHAPYVHTRYVTAASSSSILRSANDRYDSGVHHTDRLVGDFLAKVKSAGLEKKTIVVIFGDHGEEIGYGNDPKGGQHGHSQSEALIRVPLIIKAPGLAAPSVIRDTQARLIDVMPTVLELLGIPAPPSCEQGISLAGLMRGKRVPPESFAISEVSGFGPEMKAIRWQKGAQTYKFSARADYLRAALSPPVESKEFKQSRRLYDLNKDPEGTRNIMKEQRDVAEFLEQRLKDYVRSLPKPIPQKRRASQADPELQEQLKSLGY